ncbi:MAG TPA: hypothetical protein DEQ61_09770 [Streptomyces sp.]|nr:hypothetical protein [Streptomyces sp.]
MSLFSKSSAEKSAIADMKAADKALNAYSDNERRAGRHDETAEYERLNRAANEAAGKVGFWRGGNKR